MKRAELEDLPSNGEVRLDPDREVDVDDVVLEVVYGVGVGAVDLEPHLEAGDVLEMAQVRLQYHTQQGLQILIFVSFY